MHKINIASKSCHRKWQLLCICVSKLCLRITLLLSAIFVFTLVVSDSSHAEEFHRFDEILVLSRSRIASEYVGGDVTVLSSDDLKSYSVTSVTDILRLIPDITVSEKGSPGSQTDISMRGSSTDGVMILLNGVRMRDPQTGHFTLDIPIDVSEIERVEVIRGGGSAHYGTNGNGMINIITGGTDGVSFRASGGSYGHGATSLNMRKTQGNASLGLNFNGGRSDGYRKDSDIQYGGVATDGSWFSNSGLSLDWNAGYNSKRFGAGDFYGPYPSYEKTQTIAATFNSRYVINDTDVLVMRAGGRGHGDNFVLVRENPSFYRNTHYNRSYTFATEYRSARGPYYITAGSDTEQYGITSETLGSRRDNTTALYGDVTISGKSGDLSMAVRYTSTTRGSNTVSPTLGVSVPFGEKLKLRLRASRAYRLPTYTDLYYASPANIGNPNLEMEETLTVESGIDITTDSAKFSAGGFVTEADNVLDWIRYSDASPWYSVNHGEIRTAGASVSGSFKIPDGWKARIDLSRLNQTHSHYKNATSKYALNPAETIAMATLKGDILSYLSTHLTVRHEHYRVTGSRTPVSCTISKAFGEGILALRAENLLNEHFEEFPGYQAPGRWLTLSFEKTMNR